MIIKICGMRQPENIKEADNIGADWMGFICYEHSPRYVSDVPAYLPSRTKRVGVFVNAPYGTILYKVKRMRLDYVQLHGNETPEFCSAITGQGVGIIKAFSLHNTSDLKQTELYSPYCDYFLFDTPCSGYGGSGKAFDWSLLDAYNGSVPFLLSGGLHPESLPSLASFHHPRWAGIDLNSGFEIAPGIKNVPVLKSFIEQFKTLAL